MLYSLNKRSMEWVLRSQATGRLAREARNLAVDRHSSIRGYLISHQRVSLAPEFSARAPLKLKLDSLILLTAENASQLDRARAIQAAIARWERGWVTPALSATSPAAFSEEAADNLAGKELYDSIRSAFDSFLAGETRIFQRSVRIQEGLATFMFGAVIVELLLLIGVLIWLERWSYKHAREVLQQREILEAQSEDLQQQAAELEEQAVELEEQADHATQNSHALEAMNRELEATVNRMQTAERVATTAKTHQEETEGVLDFVLNHSPVAVALHDRELRFIRVNGAMATMTGTAVDKHPGRLFSDVAPEEMSDAIQPLLEQVLTTAEPITNVPVTSENPSDPMKERHFLASFFPVRLPGRMIGVGSVVLETTQYRQLEEQLLQAQKMEAVGRLAGGVAHDFNNMLTAIRSYSELLLQEMPPGSQSHADMNEVIKAAERATALTKKLLAFSRQQVLRPSRVDLNQTIEGLQRMLKRIAGKNIELTCQLGQNPWAVTADPTEIERVITNLVLNSHDAMPEGGRLIIETSNVMIDEEYANTHADTKPGPYVMIAVTDTGSGMTREVRDKLFEPFFTTKEKGKGTGLGLPSVYGIVKQSGGFIWVYSEPGRGTTFKVYLPRAEEPDGAASGRIRTPRRNRQVGGETILLVEDDEEVRQVALRILRKNGYRVLEASNGADALKVAEAQESPVDLVVTDIVMPEMGGSELAERIREKQPDARILFTSGYTEDAAMRQSFLQAGESFIEKPFTPASLSRRTREVLDSRGNGRPEDA
jgi:PAS domain S-box-containing protein